MTKQLVQYRKKSCAHWRTTLSRRGNGAMFNQGERKDKALLPELYLVRPEGSPGVLEIRVASLSSSATAY